MPRPEAAHNHPRLPPPNALHASIPGVTPPQTPADSRTAVPVRQSSAGAEGFEVGKAGDVDRSRRERRSLAGPASLPGHNGDVEDRRWRAVGRYVEDGRWGAVPST